MTNVQSSDTTMCFEEDGCVALFYTYWQLNNNGTYTLWIELIYAD